MPSICTSLLHICEAHKLFMKGQEEVASYHSEEALVTGMSRCMGPAYTNPVQYNVCCQLALVNTLRWCQHTHPLGHRVEGKVDAQS